MPRGKRPPATTTLHSLLDTLADLRTRMDHTGHRVGSMSTVEAYDSFCKNSQFGRDCQYALKTAAVFVEHDLREIAALIETAHSLLCIVGQETSSE